MADIQCDVLIIGASLGGVAAALRAGAVGAAVCLVEPSGWIGGQMTGQGVSTPDENEYVETVGSTASYRDFRQRVLRAYQKLLLGVGIPLFWWSDVPYGHPAFGATQLLGVAQIFHGNGRDLAFDVDQVLTASDAQALAARLGLTTNFPQPNITRGAAAIWLVGQLNL